MSDNEIYQDVYNKGYEAGRDDMLDRLRPLLLEILRVIDDAYKQAPDHE